MNGSIAHLPAYKHLHNTKLIPHKLQPQPNSRFGKYIKLQYDAKRQLVGAWTDHFLLEKSRLVHVDPDERNYHVFYEMLRGLPTEALEVCGLVLEWGSEGAQHNPNSIFA